jgi:hypothetical protein
MNMHLKFSQKVHFSELNGNGRQESKMHFVHAFVARYDIIQMSGCGSFSFVFERPRLSSKCGRGFSGLGPAEDRGWGLGI